ncbi:na+-driven multidrug efflux pump [Stylonychia lemnae]|uniref:Na+-driven multidrug efflux pump n=1 Tax=Stylonychia lemnae TaxID=5949 RepID=A0A078A9E4_STYLE|nr:na+-driven multidrug efflux pump [Stylonychia lemnae]|eukprot:CDW77408.1 na+-driven multidrug efflux pump [Stylonychia lemnae]
MAIPGMIASMSFALVEAMNLMFMGQFGDPALVAGVGLGNVYITIFGIITIGGINGILSTLVSQSYGQGNLYLCGVYLNRGRVIIVIAFIPIAFIMISAKYFFEFTGVQPNTAEQASLYICQKWL